MALYLVTSSVVCLIWGVAWAKSDAFNLLVKISFFGLSFWGLFEYLKAVGYIVHK